MRFSILCACYNCEKWVGKAIKSVLAQTYSDWEMLILDDRSKDGSLSVISRYVLQDKRIKLISSNEKLYCGGAYNKLASEAKGEFCGVLDADDFLCSKAIDRVVKVYDKTGADFLWTQFYLCDPNLMVLRKGFSKAPPKGKSLLDVRHAFSHWRTFRTSMREKCQVFNPEYKSAVDKWMGYALEEVGKGVFYNKPLYKYRQRLGGLSFTGRKNWEKMKKRFNQKRLEEGIRPIPIKRV